jgi:hypothetical protein
MGHLKNFTINRVAGLPVAKKKDVVVVGAGPAGCLAALAARRNGADTLLIERDSYLGGMMTGGFVNSMFGFRLNRDYVRYIPTSSWETPLLVNGISLDLVTRLQKERGTLDQHHPGDPSQREIFDPEIMKQVLDDMMEESRVEVLFNTFAFDAIVEDNVMKGVVVANKSGCQAVLADVIVDASGDADIAAAAGVPFLMGRETDGRLHGGSLMMDLGGVNVNQYVAYLKNRPQKTEEERKQMEDEASRLLGGGGSRDTILTLDGKKGWWSMGGAPTLTPWNEVDRVIREGNAPLRLPGLEYEWLDFISTGNVPPWLGAAKLIYIRVPGSTPGVIKHGKMRYDLVRSGVHEAYFDQTNQEEISKAITWMRKMNRIYLRFLAEHIPGFGDAYLMQMQPMVGTRESRRIIGEYTLCEQDCVEGRRFPDVIAKSGHACNVHTVTGIWGENLFLEPKKPFDIPYRCLVPKLIDNLLIAGRPISVTHVAHGATRDEPPCMSTGEAAGTAAAVSVRTGLSPRKLNVTLLQKKLLDQGALLFLEEEKEKEKEIRKAF